MENIVDNILGWVEKREAFIQLCEFAKREPDIFIVLFCIVFLALFVTALWLFFKFIDLPFKLIEGEQMPWAKRILAYLAALTFLSITGFFIGALLFYIYKKKIDGERAMAQAQANQQAQLEELRQIKEAMKNKQ